MRDLKHTLAELKTMVVRMNARLDAILPHLATKADLAIMETRLGAVDAKLGVMDARLDATLSHLATKAELAQIEVKLVDKPGKTYMWGILAALLTAYACGLAALVVLK